jgi:hypothetical protein
MKRQDQQPLARRTMLAGAGTVGALAAAAAILPGRQAGTTPATDKVAQAPSTEDAGYRLTEHVAQYYRTARV